MDEDKINRTIESILQNQAQFYADLQAMQEVQKQSEKRISALETAAVNFVNSLIKTTEIIEKLSEKVDKLADAQKKTDEHLRETDERLNAVVLMAEKFFSNRNGNSEKK